jgi:predicted outer membrane repeat protein
LSGNSATGFTIGPFHNVGEGGAIANVRDTTTVRDSLFSGNSAELGGAIYNAPASYGALEVQGSLFTDNTAGDSGGGIYNLGTATVQESTLSGNSAGSAGGGLFNAASGTLTIDDSHASGNAAPLGADLDNLGVATLYDSTVGVIGP